MQVSGRLKLLVVLSAILCLCPSLIISAQDKKDKPKLASEAKQAREYSLAMLDEMKDILNEYYYDPKLHGIDLKARIEAAKARVKTMEFNWQMYRVLVQVLLEFDDSHTRMMLPPREDYFQYGLAWQMIGEDCYITYVKKGSNAATQGVEPGDQLLLLGKYTPTRQDLWKMNYVLYKLDPSRILSIKIRKPDGTEKQLNVEAKTMTDKEFRAELKAQKEKRKNKEKEKDEDLASKCVEIDKNIAACKLYSFVVEKKDIDKMMKFASRYPKLILDLRGNGGGYVTIEQYLLSYFFDRKVKIADLVTKKKTETRTTEILDASKQFKGEVAVLVDSRSASASEMTARVLQIEKRAKVYGDYSSGSVMTSISVPFTSVMSAFAAMAIIRVGMSVTVADVIMSDGSRLEKTGVEPDEVLQPTGLAFKNRMDAVLAYAAVKFGAELTPDKAGTFHFITEADEESDSDDDDGKEGADLRQ
jgi:carboxyl-terminal processing protease